MEAGSLIQSYTGLSTKAGINYSTSDVDSHGGRTVNNTAAPQSDTLTLSSTNVVVARQVLTQQIDIALDIKSPPSQSSFNTESSNQFSSGAFGQNLADRVVQKIQGEHAARKGHDDRHGHHKSVAKNVSMQVSQGFQQATAVINKMGISNETVVNDVAQSRAQVDHAIDQEANRMTAQSQTATAFASDTKRELNTSLQVTTRDGDIVTIDLNRSQALTEVDAIGEGGSFAYSGASSSTQIDFSVQGDLSEKERESIGKVVEQVSELAKKVFNGNTGAAMERLSEFKIDTRQLTGVSLDMSSSFSHQAVAAYAQVSQISVSNSPAMRQNSPQSVEAPTSTAAPSNGSNNTPASTVSASNNTSSSSVSNASSNTSSSSPSNVSSNASSSSVTTSSYSSKASSGVSRSHSSVIQWPREPVAQTATLVVRQAVDVVQFASSSGSFENPFEEIARLFEQVADLFTFGDQSISDSHNDFVKALFGDVVEMLAGEQGVSDQDEVDPVDSDPAGNDSVESEAVESEAAESEVVEDMLAS